MADLSKSTLYLSVLFHSTRSFSHVNLSTALSKLVPTPLVILVPTLWRFLPKVLLSILDKAPNKQIKILHQFRRIANRTAHQVLTNIPRDTSRDIVNLLGACSTSSPFCLCLLTGIQRLRPTKGYWMKMRFCRSWRTDESSNISSDITHSFFNLGISL